MDFEKAVQLFQKKKRNAALDKQKQYAEMLKEYTAMKYRRGPNGERVERELTQEQLAPKPSKDEIKAKEQKELLDVATSLAGLIDVNVGGKK